MARFRVCGVRNGAASSRFAGGGPRPSAATRRAKPGAQGRQRGSRPRVLDQLTDSDDRAPPAGPTLRAGGGGVGAPRRVRRAFGGAVAVGEAIRLGAQCGAAACISLAIQCPGNQGSASAQFDGYARFLS